MRSIQEIFAGVGLGAAVGILVGMSTAPVVAIVVSSLVALVATFFGLSSQTTEGTKVLRIASFGLACPMAVFIGLGARSHGWLTPSIQHQIADWTNAGYSPAEARSFVAFRELGLIPEGQKTAEPQQPLGIRGDLPSETRQAECDHLLTSRFASGADRIYAMRKEGGAWKALANSLGDLDRSRQNAVVDAAYGLACQ
ncbi:hypothetical protein [Tunturiibacter gelidoferens]|uniref:Uncharacterized protein n=1 Tax=Tunturiibacter lichenicola TaxID=2051959 RepID=A0A7Y9NRE4_9BACT|nr:hypothetical protein [Edaphobacter lichenicola]NYF53942.1 hypothetical protein [Edaphobacter lichenicola]